VWQTQLSPDTQSIDWTQRETARLQIMCHIEQERFLRQIAVICIIDALLTGAPIVDDGHAKSNGLRLAKRNNYRYFVSL
jgi:hypothetical protein